MTSTDSAGQKTALRKAIVLQRNSLSEKEIVERSEAAQAYILADPAWANARSVGVYYAVRQELNTQNLMRRAWADGKQVFLPRTVSGTNGALEFLPYSSASVLQKGAFGIMEPDPKTCPAQPCGGWVPELIIVPAVAYDAKGYRLGAGGGYYDRLFARPSMRAAIRLGLAYAFQLCEELPVDPWDIPMHGICTEKGLQWLR